MSAWDQTREHWGWLISAAAAGLGYLLRRRAKDGDAPIRARWNASWLARRLAVERELLRCRQERQSDQESFTRQLAGRDEEIAYLMGKLSRLMNEGERVVSLASDRLSEPSPDAPIDSPPNSPPSRPHSRTSRAKGPPRTDR